MDWEEKKRRFIEAVKMGLTILYSQDPDKNWAHAMGHLEDAYCAANKMPPNRSPEDLACRFVQYNAFQDMEVFEEWMGTSSED